MGNYLLCGMAFGDEGKGTFIDYLSTKSLPQEITLIKYNGGAQASHTVVTDSHMLHKFSQLSSGMFNEKTKTYLLDNMILDLPHLIVEAEEFSKKINTSTSNVLKRVFLDSNCVVVLRYHKLINKLEEILAGKGARGSVGSGVSIASILSINESLAIRLKDFNDVKVLTKKLLNLQAYLKSKFHKYMESQSEVLLPLKIKYSIQREYYTITDYLYIDTVITSYKQLICNFNIVDNLEVNINGEFDIIMEGSQGLLLDKDHGLKPNTTYVDTTNKNGVKVFDMLGCEKYTKIGVVKAFYSRHGKGVFPTEDIRLNEGLTDKNQEEGYFNGKIRFGWFDKVLFDYAKKINKVEELYVSSIDMLTGLKKIKVCVAYRYSDYISCKATWDILNALFDIRYDSILKTNIITEIKCNEYIDGSGEVHLSSTYLESAIPIYKELQGWYDDISYCKSFMDLPNECIKFINYLERITDTKISLISVGPTSSGKIIIP